MKILSAIVTVAYTLSATTSLAAGGIGKAMAVIDAASASGQIGMRTLAVGSDVFVGDLVKTNEVGEAQLLFQDGTRMVVGANSSLVIEEFLFRGEAAENRFAVKALGGAFRFISGESGDENYKIHTPSGTIGVRGTAIDFTVSDTETNLISLEGAASLCDDDEEKKKKGEEEDCEIAATPCAVLRSSDDDDDKVEEVPPGERRQKVIDEKFPYVTSDEDLREDFQVVGHGCATGGLANAALGPTIPTGAIVVGTLVILGGVVIGVLLDGDSNNNTKK